MGSQVLIGDTSLGVGGNVISGNGTAQIAAGVAGTLNSSVIINGATIEHNSGGGLFFDTRSMVQASGGLIGNNTGSGVIVQAGAGAVLSTTITGNTAFGVFCSGTEASFTTTVPVSGNGAGDISPDCTGF
jgi:hypothetical protein